MVEARHISVIRGEKTLLDDVSYRPEASRISVILGPNGAGKSTLLGALAGLIAPSIGEIWLDDIPLTQLDRGARARAIGFLPQNADIHWDLPVRDLVMLGRYPYSGHSSKAQDHAAAQAAMAAAMVAEFADRRISTLSGGERARALMARAWAGEPRWLLADEPLNGLDLRHQLQLLARMRAMADGSAGIVMVLHDLTLAAQIADHILLLHAGRIFAEGAPRDVLTPENIQAVYGVTVVILNEGNHPIIVPTMPVPTMPVPTMPV